MPYFAIILIILNNFAGIPVMILLVISNYFVGILQLLCKLRHQYFKVISYVLFSQYFAIIV